MIKWVALYWNCNPCLIYQVLILHLLCFTDNLETYFWVNSLEVILKVSSLYIHIFFSSVWFALQLHSNSDKGDGSVRYILSGEGAGTIFIIDEVTGDIHATKSLDRERKTHYVLHAQALDRNTEEALEPKSEFIIKVQDINDNAPTFPDGPSVAAVPEMSEVGEYCHEILDHCKYCCLQHLFELSWALQLQCFPSHCLLEPVVVFQCLFLIQQFLNYVVFSNYYNPSHNTYQSQQHRASLWEVCWYCSDEYTVGVYIRVWSM